MESTINLFKCVLIKKPGTSKINKTLMNFTMANGFIFSPEVVHNYSEQELLELTKIVKKQLGLNKESLNNSFHKSWKKIQDASMEQLVLEQLIHYVTTYGFETTDCYDSSTVYIPVEKLKIPKIDLEKFKFVLIKGVTKDKLKDQLLNFLNTGIALKESTMKDVMDIATFLDLREKDICSIKNREVVTQMFSYLNLVPQNPIEFLRLITFKATGKSLLIKNEETITAIKASNDLSVVKCFSTYDTNFGLNDLASIFYRFKPLFLAFRKNTKTKVIINKIRRLARVHHKPMQEDFLNNVTNEVLKGKKFDFDKLQNELNRVNVFRKIRLAYALNFRMTDCESITYRVRNGKSFSTSFQYKKNETLKKVYNLVIKSIKADSVKDKVIYIPKNISYALPSTEKQFSGNVPAGTCVSTGKNLILGVNWLNVEHNRVDLDLSLVKIDGKIGWDANYRTRDGSDIMFSGDITDAPRPLGATELFYVRHQKVGVYALMLNYYNHYSDVTVPFKIIVANELLTKFGKDFMVDPNRVDMIVKSEIKDKQKILGLLVVNEEESKFYFAESVIGNSITSHSDTDYIEHSRTFLKNYYQNTVDLKQILKNSGAIITSDKNKKSDIDLSYENITKETIMNLLKVNNE